MKGGGSCVVMKRDKDYGLVSGNDELRILRELDEECKHGTKTDNTNCHR